MTLKVRNFDGAQALDIAQLLQGRQGTGVVSGCEPDLGNTDQAVRVNVSSGTAYIEDTEVSVSGGAVDLPDGDSQHPRKDVVYATSTGGLASAQGVPRSAQDGTISPDPARGVYQPEPPDLSGVTGGVTAVAPIAEVWVPESANGASDLDDPTIRYVRDRRLRPWASPLLVKGAIGADSGLTYDDGTDELGLDIIASGQDTLSSGSLTIDTGVDKDATATFGAFIGGATDDAEVAADTHPDTGTGTHVVEIQETDTNIGNPTVNYDIVRVR